MVQVIEQSDPFGRIGKAFGQGLAEQVPKEVDRYRLSSGLKNLEKESANLSPLQQFTRIASIPGVTPQMIQALPEILKQQNTRQSRSEISKSRENQENVNPQGVNLPNFSNHSKNLNKSNNHIKIDDKEERPAPVSITTEDPLRATLRPYIPKTFPQLQDQATNMMEKFPKLHADYKDYLQDAILEDQQNQSIQTHKEANRIKELGVQDRAVKDFRDLLTTNNVNNLPGEIIADYESNVLNRVRNGQPEREAADAETKDALNYAKLFTDAETLGGHSYFSKARGITKDPLKEIQKDFKKRGGLEHLANTLTSSHNLPPAYSYNIAYPVSSNKKTAQLIHKNKIPSHLIEDDPKAVEKESIRIADEIIKNWSNEDSPLSIALQLKSKNFDPNVFLNRLSQENNKKDFMSSRQGREMKKSRDMTPTLDSFFMYIMSGLDPLVEE